MADTAHHSKTYPVPAGWARPTTIDDTHYLAMYAASIADPDAFWAEHGKRIDWFTPYTITKNVSFAPGNVSIKWYEDGVTNISYNCIDRHLATRANQTAIIWEGDDPRFDRKITYAELHLNVCR